MSEFPFHDAIIGSLGQMRDPTPAELAASAAVVRNQSRTIHEITPLMASALLKCLNEGGMWTPQDEAHYLAGREVLRKIACENGPSNKES